MREIAIARWRIEYDAEATSQCYAQLPTGSGCDCLYCRNFLGLGERVFPQEFRRFTDQMGIDVAKPAELCDYFLHPSTGLHISGGWFHLVGRIVQGADALQNGRLHLESLSPPFEFGFSSNANLIPEPFRAHRVVQLQFLTQVAWVLPDPDPESS
ncbi:MAG: hypothetical protein ACT4QC_10340 [Planctomycetaceae bacterium]